MSNIDLRIKNIKKPNIISDNHSISTQVEGQQTKAKEKLVERPNNLSQTTAPWSDQTQRLLFTLNRNLISWPETMQGLRGKKFTYN